MKIIGVKEVKTDSKNKMVVVKGKNADVLKICERVQKKMGKKVEIIFQLPKQPEGEQPKQIQPEQNNEEQPKPITVVLKVRMHCEACTKVLQKRMRKINGVESVETDLLNDQLIIKGIVDPKNLADIVYRKTRKRVSIVPIEEKREEEKKNEKEKNEEKHVEEKKEEPKQEDDKKLNNRKTEDFPPMLFMEYTYAYMPDIFSEENPNACSVM